MVAKLNATEVLGIYHVVVADFADSGDPVSPVGVNPSMNTPDGFTRKARKAAYVFHLILAVLVCIATALYFHLRAIDARGEVGGEVVGAGIFLFVIWFGLPAIVSLILAIYYSVKASDTRLSWLLIWMTVPVLAFLFSTPEWLMLTSLAAYVVLVVVVGLLLRRAQT